MEAGSHSTGGPSSCTQSWLDCTAGLHQIVIGDIALENYIESEGLLRNRRTLQDLKDF